MTVSFILTSLIIIASPGTGVLVTLAAGLSHGSRAACIAALGCTLGIIPHMLLAITGLAVLLHANPFIFSIVKYAGASYLLFMAWVTLKEHGTLALEENCNAHSSLEVIRSAILVNVLNPKLSIFFLAYLPQFISKKAPLPLFQMLVLSLVFMVMTFVVFVTYGIFAAAWRQQITTRPSVLTWIRRIFALALLGLASKLAFVS